MRDASAAPLLAAREPLRAPPMRELTPAPSPDTSGTDLAHQRPALAAGGQLAGAPLGLVGERPSEQTWRADYLDEEALRLEVRAEILRADAARYRAIATMIRARRSPEKSPNRTEADR